MMGWFSDIRSYPRGKDKRLSRDFHLREFECKCGKCETTLVSRRHVRRLQRLRDELGRGISITSGYRCEAHNARVGGSPKSQHLRGTATDIVLFAVPPAEVAALGEQLFDGVGVYDTFTHLDSRGEPARWDMRSNSS